MEPEKLPTFKPKSHSFQKVQYLICVCAKAHLEAPYSTS